MKKISIHALREEGDRLLGSKVGRKHSFQSTPSARRATLPCLVTWSSHRYFNPRPPRGERRPNYRRPTPNTYFNPRPPRGGRPDRQRNKTRRHQFQSTLSARRATSGGTRMGCTVPVFQSTPSARRATQGNRQSDEKRGVSIHALREEGD